MIVVMAPGWQGRLVCIVFHSDCNKSLTSAGCHRHRVRKYGKQAIQDSFSSENRVDVLNYRSGAVIWKWSSPGWEGQSSSGRVS
jgi:hypothetical protein